MASNAGFSLKRLILISRPALYIPAVAVYLAGVNGAHAKLSVALWFGALFLSFPFGIIAYGLNDIADRESDAKNPRKGRLDGVIITSSEIKTIQYSAHGLAALFVAGFVIFNHPLTALCVAAIWLLLYAYSVPPLRLKTRPPLDSFTNGLGITLIFLSGFWVNTTALQHSSPSGSLLLAILLFAAAVHAYGSLPDYEADKQAGDRTIGVVFGKHNTILFSIGCLVLCLLLLARPLYIWYLLLCIGFMAGGWWLQSAKYYRLVAVSIILAFPAVFIINKLVA